MAYNALVANLLISAPSDIPEADLVTIRRTVSQWNVSYGRQFGVNVVPISWSEHAVSEFGDRPQEILNRQLVEFADLGIALFANRLGSDTGHAPSGTWEEVLELHKAGKHVSILRNVAAIASVGSGSAEERLRLENHFEAHKDQLLWLTYSNEAELQGHVQNCLSRAVSQFQQRVASDTTTVSHDESSEDESQGIWPRIEISEFPKTNTKGRLVTARRWTLVLSNMTGRIARNVRFELDAGDNVFARGREYEPIEEMAPNGEVGFPLHFVLGSGSQAICRVTWEDSKGEHSTSTTVRR